VHVVPNGYKFDFAEHKLVLPNVAAGGPGKRLEKVKAANFESREEK
jgi:hypothetical protein